ncbi:MAG: hypothetical protein JRN52_05820 [Nitrososphaerota archaeon]|nr:hypothetical protein [Nitrososphaerota archaeon]
MRYRIRISGKEKEVGVTLSAEKCTVKFAEKKADISIIQREQTGLVVSLGERHYKVRQLKRTPSSVSFVMNGKFVEASTSAGKAGVSSRSSLASVKELVSSNFPAKVVKVNARVGDELREGATLIVLEAMKMEAQIRVPGLCKVVAVYVKDGEMVEKGKPLVRLSFI